MERLTGRLQQLYASGELAQRRHRAREMLAECHCCPRACGVNRLRGELGKCGVGEQVIVSSAGPHHGEEPPLSGWKGSGTVFFSGCNLACVFCQNWEISQRRDGQVLDETALGQMFLSLQGAGCHNLNLVTPSHIVPQILGALVYACEKGFDLPVVYNSGGYDSLEQLKLLDGVVDVYMPDLKFHDSLVAEPYLGVANYAEVSRAAMQEMFRQVGDLAISASGIARRGLLVRHLVLPEGVAGTQGIVDYLADEVSQNTYLNLMDQYRPCFRAHEFQALRERLSRGLWKEACRRAREKGLRLDRG